MPSHRVADERVGVKGVDLFVRRLVAPGPNADARPTLVFLHDSLGCVATWRDFPQALAEATCLNALVYDRQGHGQSPPFGGAVRPVNYLAAQVDPLMALLDALSIHNAILFGHSDGGSIALIAAGLHPDRIIGVITEGAHVFVEDETLAGVRAAKHAMATTDLPQRLVRYHGDKVAALASAWIDTWLSPAYRDWSIESYLADASCPALIIQGTKDEYGTVAQVDAIIHGMRGRADGLMIPDIGHTPHREARGEVMRASSAFVERVLAGNL